MSKEQRRQVRKYGVVAVIGIAAATVATAVGIVAAQSRHGTIRTIVLSAQDYAFNGSNPDLKLVAGETVRIVVRNDEDRPSVIHNFKIPGLNIACDTPIKPGESREFVLKVPKRGEFMYTCCAHPGMGGKIAIGPKP